MPKRKIQAKSLNENLLIHILKDMNKKIDHIHTDINQHGKEITELKEQLAMSKGGLKVIIAIAAMIGTIFTIWQYFVQK
jgi:hypothetical protein